MRRSPVLVFALSVLLAAPSAFAWGYASHRRLFSRLSDPIPNGNCVKSWLASASTSTAYQDKATEPDEWRLSDDGKPQEQKEWPNHFLHVDKITPFEDYPRDEAAMRTRFGGKQNGFVPWRAEEYYRLLVEKMRNGDSTGALTTTAHLSHYVTDAFSVLHDTKDFDPHQDLNGDNGLHERWESDMLKTNSTQLNSATTGMATYLGTVGKTDIRHNLFDIIIVGSRLNPELRQADLDSDGGSASLFANTRTMVSKRFADSVTLMASAVGSAWVEAGRPMLAGMPAGCSTDFPQGDIVLKGYAATLKAPVPDAGVDAGGPQLAEDLPAEGCEGCGSTTASMLIPLAGLAMVLSSRRRG